MANIDGSHGGPGRGDSRKSCGHGVNWNVCPREGGGGGVHNRPLAIAPATSLLAREKKRGDIQSHEHHLCKLPSSGYNQKHTRAFSHTQCDISAVSTRTVFRDATNSQHRWRLENIRQSCIIDIYAICLAPNSFVCLLCIPSFYCVAVLLQYLNRICSQKQTEMKSIFSMQVQKKQHYDCSQLQFIGKCEQLKVCRRGQKHLSFLFVSLAFKTCH